jgi:NAD(P)-dependent dehydrogenase (short-subunit alcohol dehydrogenase family)
MTKPVCLITGAGGRLGQMLCRELLSRYIVAAAYRTRPPAVSSQLMRPYQANGGPSASDDVYCIQGDLTRRHDIQRIVEVCLARYGRIDAVVNAAADVHFHGKLVEVWQADDYAQTQLLTNALAPMQLVSAVFENCWRDDPRGNALWNRSVLNVSSYSAQYAYPDTSQAVYGASKAALNLLTLYLSLELAPYSVRANIVCPGRFDDDASTKRVVDSMQAILSGKMTGAVVEPEVAVT